MHIGESKVLIFSMDELQKVFLLQSTKGEKTNKHCTDF